MGTLIGYEMNLGDFDDVVERTDHVILHVPTVRSGQLPSYIRYSPPYFSLARLIQ
jgi:hypothetical protein